MKRIIIAALLFGCAPAAQAVQPPGPEAPAVTSCPMPTAPASASVARYECSKHDLAEAKAIAHLAAIGLVSAGGCEGETIQDCDALDKMLKAYARIIKRACPEPDGTVSL